MATIINNPPSNQAAPSDGGGVAGIIVGVVIAAILIFVFIIFGLPALRGAKKATEGGVTVPTTIQVPDKIDVNINK